MELIKQIKIDFDTLTTSRSDILELFNENTCNINKINKIYTELVKTHHSKESLFGLDSFLFQNKMFEMEHENMRKLFNWYNGLQSTGNLKVKEADKKDDATDKIVKAVTEKKATVKKTATKDTTKTKTSTGVKKTTGVRKTGVA